MKIKNGNKVSCVEIISDSFTKEIYGRNRKFVKCRCVCGEIFERNLNTLKRAIKAGQVVSCGCNGKRLDIGYKFNFLEIVSNPYYKKVDYKTREFIKMIDCKCVCGKTKPLQFCSVYKERPYSCGCKSRLITRKKLQKGSMVENGYKKCSTCQENKSIENYVKNKNTTDKFNARCKQCQFSSYLLRNYNLTKEEGEKIFKENTKCGCCGKNDGSKLFVDHCHVTGNVRGLLCSNCNSGIGMLNDDVKLLYKAINYLECGDIKF